MDELSPFDHLVRSEVYRHFVEHARAPALTDLARTLDSEPSTLQESLERLESHRALALTPATRGIWMAHPFSAVPTGYPVKTAERTYWANCAWDALAIPLLLNTDTETLTHCPDCTEPLTMRVRNGIAEPAGTVVHFLVPAKRFWENVGFT